MSNTVSITLTSSNYYNQSALIIKTGELVKLNYKKKYKRFYLECVSGGHGTATLKTVYKPSPKSVLNKKSVFSKIKCKVVTGQAVA